ncbi:MAG: 2-isopropylmalate synthase [Chloroflexota bacterium]
MQSGKITKYKPFPIVDLPDRTWPNQAITSPPIWCSVDLRDGNQALPIPMSVEEKLEMFQLLVDIGFKEIEVGFPAASQIEYDFMRRLIEENLIPEDVTIQVLVQCREALIERTFESLRGAKKAILHLYNSTSPLQRRVVFGMKKAEIINIAVEGTEIVKRLTREIEAEGTDITFQYSPESFSSTELDFALQICEEVMNAWQPTAEKSMILNLPATVEVYTPNVHADAIEWFCRNLQNREAAIISLHPHNDRGSAVAATELGLMAGADRVEGTLFGNGERTGNVDIVTLALNLYTQGVDPLLNFGDINNVSEVYTRTTRMEIPVRQPYVGDLVFTAFSGSHQDAINKGMHARPEGVGALWAVPYLPIDPKDVGRTYEAIIRINAQSGKGGVAYVLENDFGIQMPKAMHVEFGKIINVLADAKGDELSANQIYQAFKETYLESASPFKLESFKARTSSETEIERNRSHVSCIAEISIDGTHHTIEAEGNGPIDAFVQGLKEELVSDFELLFYSEHSLGQGAEARAISYIQIETPSGEQFFGAATDTSIELSSIKAVISAINQAMQSKPSAESMRRQNMKM